MLEYPPDVKADFSVVENNEEEDVEATAENELGVDEDDGFGEENNLPLAE